MARRKAKSTDWLFPTAALQPESEGQSSLLDVVDSVLNKGAVVNGDVVLGVANVDLIYVKLSVLVAALDRVMKHEDPRRRGDPRRGEDPPRKGDSRRTRTLPKTGRARRGIKKP